MLSIVTNIYVTVYLTGLGEYSQPTWQNGELMASDNWKNRFANLEACNCIGREVVIR
jgi:hypothetical protein